MSLGPAYSPRAPPSPQGVTRADGVRRVGPRPRAGLGTGWRLAKEDPQPMPSPQVGDLVEAYCRRCKLNLGATVAAVVGDEIVRVVCRTCDESQRYSAPRTERKVGRRVVDVQPTRKRRRTPMPSLQIPHVDKLAPPQKVKRRPTLPPKTADELRWEEATKEADSRFARPHRAEERYDAGELILDKRWGMGVVEAREEDGTLVVLFRGGVRRMPSAVAQDAIGRVRGHTARDEPAHELGTRAAGARADGATDGATEEGT